MATIVFLKKKTRKKAKSAKNTQNKQHTKAKNKRLPQKPRSGVGARGTSPPQKKARSAKKQSPKSTKNYDVPPKKPREGAGD